MCTVCQLQICTSECNICRYLAQSVAGIEWFEFELHQTVSKCFPWFHFETLDLNNMANKDDVELMVPIYHIGYNIPIHSAFCCGVDATAEKIIPEMVLTPVWKVETEKNQKLEFLEECWFSFGEWLFFWLCFVQIKTTIPLTVFFLDSGSQDLCVVVMHQWCKVTVIEQTHCFKGYESKHLPKDFYCVCMVKKEIHSFVCSFCVDEKVGPTWREHCGCKAPRRSMWVWLFVCPFVSLFCCHHTHIGTPGFKVIWKRHWRVACSMRVNLQ